MGNTLLRCGELCGPDTPDCGGVLFCQDDNGRGAESGRCGNILRQSVPLGGTCTPGGLQGQGNCCGNSNSESCISGTCQPRVCSNFGGSCEQNNDCCSLQLLCGRGPITNGFCVIGLPLPLPFSIIGGVNIKGFSEVYCDPLASILGISNCGTKSFIQKANQYVDGSADGMINAVFTLGDDATVEVKADVNCLIFINGDQGEEYAVTVATVAQGNMLGSEVVGTSFASAVKVEDGVPSFGGYVPFVDSCEEISLANITDYFTFEEVVGEKEKFELDAPSESDGCAELDMKQCRKSKGECEWTGETGKKKDDGKCVTKENGGGGQGGAVSLGAHSLIGEEVPMKEMKKESNSSNRAGWKTKTVGLVVGLVLVLWI